MPPTTDIPLDRIPDPPRRVNVNRTGWVRRFQSYPLLLYPLAFLWLLLSQAATDRQLSRTGIRITTRLIHKHRGRRADDFALKYQIAGQSQFRRFPVAADEFDRYSVGSSVPLTCDPQGKVSCQVGALTPQDLRSRFVNRSVPFLIVLPFCSILPILMEILIRRQRRLLQEGLATIATIQKVTDRGNRVYRICYQYEADGNRHDGTITAKVPASNQPSEGSGITVIYNPAAAGKSSPLIYLTAVSLKDGDFLTSGPAKSAVCKKSW